MIAGQAEIHLVRNAETGDEAVMKKLLSAPQLLDPNAESRRFQREVRCQSALRHPGVMPILGWNFSASPPWYLMPRADGTLADLIAAHPDGLDSEDAAEIILAVAEAVEFAHQEGVLHRDLKPANVLDLEGRWVVGDFGLCRDLSSDSTTFTQSGMVVGTVAYMAPEQFDHGHAAGVEADVFGLGRVLYHALTGKIPFPYAPLERVPAQFRYLVARAMAEEPQQRYRTIAEFARGLELLTFRRDALTAPAERGKALLADALRDDPGAIEELLALILGNAEDEVFHHEFVSDLPRPILAALQKSNPRSFADLVRTFDRYSEGGHPFSHVDVIADFFANVFAIADEPVLRQLSLRRIMIVGYEHNRFYVQRLLCRLVSNLSDPQDILLAANVLRAEPGAAAWYREEMQSRSLAPAVRAALGNAS